MTIEGEEELHHVQLLAEGLFNAVRDHHLQENLPFAGTHLPDGSVAVPGPGNTLLPSLTEMQDLNGLISLVLSSWIQSGKLPTVQALRSSVESSEVDPVVYIITLYSMAMLGAFLPSICSGDLDTVISILNLMTNVEEQQDTSPTTYSRPTRRILSGDSTPASQVTTSPSSPSKSAGPGGNSTAKRKRKKRQIARKSKKRK